jgi:hypothetical protein
MVLPVLADPDDDAEADDDEPDAAVLDEPLLQALTTPSVSMAAAAVPYRHRLPVLLPVGLTCYCLLASKVLR